MFVLLAAAGLAACGVVPSTTPQPPAPAIRSESVHVVGNQLVTATGTPVRLLGVNASGTENACIQGHGFGAGPMDSSEADAIVAWHSNVVRVPLNEDCWLGINGSPVEYSGAAYQARIETWVRDLNAAGLIAILDLHWSAPGTEPSDQQWPMPDTHSILFWEEVAEAFKDDPATIFDLFNEPYLGRLHPTTQDWSCWLHGCKTSAAVCSSDSASGCRMVDYSMIGMQRLVDAVRSTGARQPLMVGGLDWAGDPCGITSSRRTQGCAWLKFEPTDPDHQLIASFHTYNFTPCDSVACWNQSVAPVAMHVPIVTGELGEKNCSAGYIDRYMTWADGRGISYLAWAWQLGQTMNPAGSAHATSTCGANNTHLISDWTGSPNPDVPAGIAFRGHLVRLASGRLDDAG